MNKEVIKKYKDVFDYWIDGGKLYMADKSETPLNWLPLEPTWSSSDIIYIIDDEYLHLRKALAEGKVIQYNPLMSSHDRWDDIPKENKLSPTKCDTIKNYRIKPDEPTFKVGDWVKDSSDVYVPVIRVDANAIYYISSKGTDGYIENWYILKNNIKPWKPQPDEWCWFWDGFSKNAPILSRFRFKADGKYICTNSEHLDYANCEPFIGTLPSNLKD